MGYQTDTLEQNKFVIKAIQFEDVTSGKVEVNKVFTGFKDVAGEIDWSEDGDPDAFMLTAPQIQVQKASGAYDIYYYVTNAYVEDGTNEGGFTEGWADASGVYKDLALTPGTAVWVKTPDGVDSTASGAVATEAAAVTVSKDKFTLLGNAFPVAVTLNGKQMTITGLQGSDVDWSEDGDPDAFMLTAPQIQVQKASGAYDIYYYVTNAYVEDGTNESGFAEGWADASGVYVTTQIPAGRGFWLKASTDVKVTFNL